MTKVHKTNSLSIMERVLRLRQYMASMPTPLPDGVPNNNPPTRQSTLQIRGNASPKESFAWDDFTDWNDWGKWR